MLESLKKLSFGGHESFAFRQGWLKKGVDAIKSTASAFVEDDAVVRLGVGKNMVRSIRTWSLATQIIAETPAVGGARLRPLAPTSIGERLLADEGWDPYCEDPATLWLIHWLLVTNPDKLSMWRLLFMDFKEREFTKKDILYLATNHIRAAAAKVEQGTLDRDVDCLIRTYVSSRTRHSTTGEEDFDCPLTELGLILSGSSDRFGFAIGPKDSLAPEIFGYAMAKFIQEKNSEQLGRSVSILTFESGSPGQAFKLDEDSVIELGRQLELKYPMDVFVDVDGPVRRMGLRRELVAEFFLESYYAGAGL
jgi:hypothetical protein